MPSEIQVEAFADSLSSFEASVIKEALDSTNSAYSEEMKTSLILYTQPFWLQGVP